MREERGDRGRALAAVPSLNTIAPQLEVYEALLRRWQSRINLVGPATLDAIWWRHFADSAQVVDAVSSPLATTWVDFGSGAGFPGLIVALLTGATDTVTLVESDTRKAAFLREVSRETGAGATIVTDRAEAFVRSAPAPSIVTSRAFAPWPALLFLAQPWLSRGTEGVFLVGDNAAPASDPSLCVAAVRSLTGSGFVVNVRSAESDRS